MKILVAIDSSPSSQAVISSIAARRWPVGTTARVLNVVGSVSVYSGIPDIEPLVSAESENAKALVRSAVDQLASRGIESAWVVTPDHAHFSAGETASRKHEFGSEPYDCGA